MPSLIQRIRLSIQTAQRRSSRSQRQQADSPVSVFDFEDISFPADAKGNHVDELVVVEEDAFAGDVVDDQVVSTNYERGDQFAPDEDTVNDTIAVEDSSDFNLLGIRKSVNNMVDENNQLVGSPHPTTMVEAPSLDDSSMPSVLPSDDASASTCGASVPVLGEDSTGTTPTSSNDLSAPKDFVDYQGLSTDDNDEVSVSGDENKVGNTDVEESIDFKLPSRGSEAPPLPTAALAYDDPSRVPSYDDWLVGKAIKVKESLTDAKKRGKEGTVVCWKTKSSVEIKCKSGQVFGVRVGSIEFVLQQYTENGEENTATIDLPGEQSQESFQSKVQDVTVNETHVDDTIKEVKSSVTTSHIVPAATNQEDHTDHTTDQQSSETFYYRMPSDVPSKCDSICGKRVKVKSNMTDAKKRNATGTVTKWKNKSTVEVKCDNGPVFGVKLTSIDFLGGTDSATTELLNETQSRVPATRTRPKNRVRQVTTKIVRSVVNTPRNHKKRTARRASIKAVSTDDSVVSNDGESWRVPGSSDGSTKFGGFVLQKLRLKGEHDKSEVTLIGHLLQNRVLTVDIPLNGRNDQKAFEKRTVDEAGNTFDLVSCKVYDDEQLFGMRKSQLARLVYAKTGGPGLEPFSIEDHLLRIADFTTLNPRKIAARLELLQSPSGLKIVFLDDSDFMDIPDLGYVGGGFIDEHKLHEVLQTAGLSKAHASRVVAIQVRLFIPSMGLFKGMLMKRRSADGAPIQLPWSMQKVLKSADPETLRKSALVICQAGIHPSPGSANEYIGRRLDPSRKAPPEKSFKGKIKKPLSEMIFRLWQTMGVPKELCRAYEKESLTTKRRNHAWLVGVPDPTNTLPPDTIFVPGMTASQTSLLFVTRSPCYAYSHGRILKACTTKPAAMSSEDWDWLNSELNFGVIIFSNPRSGMKSIPERIANGDLDGDLYLVCWDSIILASMTALPLVDEVSHDDGKLSTGDSNPNWFNDAQEVIVDAGLNNDIGRLTGKLYKLGEKVADGSDSILKDPDANAYYEAYNQCLEFKKHGRRIALPRHLVHTIPPNLHDRIEIEEEGEFKAISGD